MRTVDEVYGVAFAEEAAFEAALDQSLAPRGFSLHGAEPVRRHLDNAAGALAAL